MKGARKRELVNINSRK